MTDVIIVGAGLSGLVAARTLSSAGQSVTVFDKGRSVGGRLATRRIAGARLDHGAQFMTVRSDAFAAQVDDWATRGLARVWCNGFGGGDGHPRWIGSSGMNSLAKDLASGLDVRVDHLVFSCTREHDRWVVTIDDGQRFDADVLVLTAPVPQSFSMVFETVDVPRALMATEPHRTIGLLAVLDGASAVPEPGGVQDPNDDISFVADNAAKGISDIPAITLHASPSWSLEHWDDSDLEAQLTELARPWIGTANIIESQVKKWRLATPTAIWPEPCWVDVDHRVVIGGDAFAGPRVEAAHNSGLAAGKAAISLCTPRR
ncbi:MAG: NAD(P)/FAD-dependent oxidoreductase [Ilumatobacteraceae bacterium]|jgi:renalase